MAARRKAKRRRPRNGVHFDEEGFWRVRVPGFAVESFDLIVIFLKCTFVSSLCNVESWNLEFMKT
jgi:hypothetical protein